MKYILFSFMLLSTIPALSMERTKLETQITSDFDTRNAHINTRALQADGKIVVGGRSSHNSFMLARYNQNGSIDRSFGKNGFIVTQFPESRTSQISSLVIQPDGKIVAAGIVGSGFGAARYNKNGTLDRSFGDSGIVIDEFNATDIHVESFILNTDGTLTLTGRVENLRITITYTKDGIQPFMYSSIVIPPEGE